LHNDKRRFFLRHRKEVRTSEGSEKIDLSSRTATHLCNPILIKKNMAQSSAARRHQIRKEFRGDLQRTLSTKDESDFQKRMKLIHGNF
jgi:hypothetical protein